ncbi:transcriptional regulator, TetR family [Cohaesibacter gelatinilyticus]|uniref:Transcriptional regulator, TetR family n=2 Tax=Cohaesibacter gelatinilyticus TaxID=372072 RepID=A0A285NIE5_9HYPH|nr:transcriptional regulator, TetR family [Cohaesibacter gelatinilyticus]
MARPREFEMDQALQGAMEIFWAQGYGATNLPDLLKAMGLTRGSFYKAFVDKRSVYLAALDFYDQQVVSQSVSTLNQADDPDLTQTLMPLFGNDVESEQKSEAARRGCFICNAMVELAPTDAEVAQRTNAMADRLYRAIYGQISNHRPAMQDNAKEDKAQAVLHLYFGAQAMGKAGRQPHKWQSMLEDLLI